MFKLAESNIAFLLGFNSVLEKLGFDMSQMAQNPAFHSLGKYLPKVQSVGPSTLAQAAGTVAKQVKLPGSIDLNYALSKLKK